VGKDYEGQRVALDPALVTCSPPHHPRPHASGPAYRARERERERERDTYIHIIDVCVYMHMCVHIYIYICVRVRVNVCVCVCVRANVRVCIRAPAYETGSLDGEHILSRMCYLECVSMK
jgi:hypothetical protein